MKYKLGLFHGRFQHLHLGHQRIIDQMLQECERSVVLVGNCQAMGTPNDPFDVLTRMDLINDVYYGYGTWKYEGDITIKFFPDLPNVPYTYDEYEIFGDWIMRWCEYYHYASPDVVYGGQLTKLDWLYPIGKYPYMKKVWIDRDWITGTYIREQLLAGDRREWELMADPKIHYRYEELRDIVRRANQ